MRIRLTIGCWAVSTAPDVCVWMRTCIERGSFAPKRSFIVVAQIRRIARILQTSSKKSLAWENWKPNRGRTSSGSRPACWQARTSSMPKASMSPISWTAEPPASSTP